MEEIEIETGESEEDEDLEFEVGNDPSVVPVKVRGKKALALA